MKNLLSSIITYKSAFVRSSHYRMSTSVSNKQLHADMINALNRDDYDSVKEILNNDFYRKPLIGVIYCMDVDYLTKEEFLNELD